MPSKPPKDGSDQGKSNSANGPASTADDAADFSSRLRGALDAKSWTPYRLAQETGLSERHLEDMVAGHVHQPRSSTIRRIAEALGISIGLLAPGAVEGTEYVVFLTPHDQDVLFAAGSLRREPLAAVLRRQVESAVADLKQDPAVQGVLKAMTDGRQRHERLSRSDQEDGERAS